MATNKVIIRVQPEPDRFRIQSVCDTVDSDPEKSKRPELDVSSSF
jgi:hypothetical protein